MTDLDQLRESLKSPDVTVRAAAAESLCQAGEDAVAAAVDLVSATGDEESVQVWAVAALEELGPPAGEHVEALSKLATDPQAIVAYWAITLLGRLEESAASAEPVLAERVLNATDASVRERAVWALGKIGPQSNSAVEALRVAAGSDSNRLANMAQAVLSEA